MDVSSVLEATDSHASSMLLYTSPMPGFDDSGAPPRRGEPSESALKSGGETALTADPYER